MYLYDLGADRRSWLVHASPDRAEVWPDGDPAQARPVAVDPGAIWFVQASADGRWAVSTEYPGKDLHIWDARSATKVRSFSGYAVGFAWFSPDSQWVIGSTPHEYRLWKAGTWEPGPVWPVDLGGLLGGNIAFARNGRLVALQDGQDAFRLVTFPEGRELVRLEAPRLLGATKILMNEEGTRLWILGFSNRVYEWDLAALRKELAAMGLDWQE